MAQNSLLQYLILKYNYIVFWFFFFITHDWAQKAFNVLDCIENLLPQGLGPNMVHVSLVVYNKTIILRIFSVMDWNYNLGQNGWKIKTTPPPISMMEKMARFRCRASTSLNWGEGCLYFSFYSVQDCSLELMLSNAAPFQVQMTFIFRAEKCFLHIPSNPTCRLRL